MFTFDYQLVDFVGEEVHNPSVGPASDATEIQLQQGMLLWDLSMAFEKSSRTTSVWPPLSISPARSYCEDQLCFTGMPLVKTVLSISDDVIAV